MSLAALYEKLAQVDEEQVQEQEEMNKLAAEHDAAGRIMARGFMDELNKLAQQDVDISKSPYEPVVAERKNLKPKANPAQGALDSARRISAGEKSVKMPSGVKAPEAWQGSVK